MSSVYMSSGPYLGELHTKQYNTRPRRLREREESSCEEPTSLHSIAAAAKNFRCRTAGPRGGPQVSGPPRTPGREGREEREEEERGLSVRRLSAAVSPPAAHQLTDPMMAGDRSTEGAQIRAAESGKVQLVEPGVGAEFRWCCSTSPLCVRPGYGFCCRVRCESTQCGSTP